MVLPVSPDVRVGVGVMITRGNRVLLLRRKSVHGAGTWSTPGGHMEKGETIEDCAIRETREESGLEVGNVRFLAITNDVFREGDRHYITIWMRADAPHGEPSLAAPEEADDIGWYAWDALPQPLFPPMQRLLAGECLPVGAFSKR